ncbi:MAG: hypothetical protein ACFFD8_05385 [Candidatus Thorarchaeota archaeon]
MIVLEYQDGTFVEAKQGSNSIRCEVDKSSKKIRMILPQDTNLIERRTALRLADTIARSGYLLSTGERVGQGFELILDEKGTAIPDRLKQSPRISYSSATIGSVVDKK